MSTVTYSVERLALGYIVVLHDPVFSRPWYLKRYGKNGYRWSTTYGRYFSERTAHRHAAALAAGADHDWPAFSRAWEKEYGRLGLLPWDTDK